jgi:hypothetical protein
MTEQRSADDPHRFANRLRIEPFRDPVVEQVGHEPDSVYSRCYWLPLVGPATFLCGGVLTDGLGRQPDGYEIDVALLGAALGLTGGTGRSSTIARTLDRMTRFGLARHHPTQALFRVRLAWPPLTRRQLAALPAALALLHPAA